MKRNEKFIDDLTKLVYIAIEDKLPSGFIIANMEALKFRLLYDNLTDYRGLK